MDKPKLKNFFMNWELYIAGTFMCVMILIAAANALLRYIMNSPIYASDEIVLTLFIWTIFLGASYCYREKLHIGIDLFVNLLPGKVRTFFVILVDVILIATNAVMAYLSIQLSVRAVEKLIPMLQIPYTVRDAAAAVSFIMMTFYSIRFLINDLKAINNRT